jgi:hypothetical protein
MVVRVKLRVSRGSSAKIVTVLVSSGAESEEPVVVLRPEDAVELGFSLRRDFDVIEVELASGKTQCFISRSRVRVELLDDSGNVLSATQAYLAVDEGLTEPLITDATIDELGITVISFKRGLWRHSSDSPSVIRQSAT